MKNNQNNYREFGRKMFQQFLDVLQTPVPRAPDCDYESVWADADEPRCGDGLAPLASPASFDIAHHIEGIGQSHGCLPVEAGALPVSQPWAGRAECRRGA